MRKRISAELKAKVAIEAVKGVKTISEISSLYKLGKFMEETILGKRC